MTDFFYKKNTSLRRELPIDLWISPLLFRLNIPVKHPTRGAHQSRRHDFAKRSGIRIAKVRVRVIIIRRRRKGKPEFEQ